MSHRLFIGLRPPEAVRDALLDAMEDIEDARWQSDEQLHITLRFLGDVSRPDANALADALARVEAEPFAVAIDGIGHFERKGKPRAVWARVVPSEPLFRLKRKIDRVCSACGQDDEHRKFLPHVTLARLNSASGPIGRFLAARSNLRPPLFSAERFVLFESRMGRGGSHYEPVADYPLG